MKYLVIFTCLAILFSGCSSSNETNKSVNGANIQNSSTGNSNNAAMTNVTPTELKPYNGFQNVNPNAFNATNDNLKVVKTEPKQSATPFGQRTAPDDSVVTSGSRGKEFFEMRTFNNHPTLAKVEKIMDGATTKFKVYLKNGKVLEAPADKMSNFTAMAPENILAAAGVQPKQETSSPNLSNKKDQQNQ